MSLSFQVVSALLDFLYTGEMTVDRSDTADLQRLIETLQINPELISVDVVDNGAAENDENVENDEESEEKVKEICVIVRAPAASGNGVNQRQTQQVSIKMNSVRKLPRGPRGVMDACNGNRGWLHGACPLFDCQCASATG